MVEIVPVKKEEKYILENLLEKYQYEFSQYACTKIHPSGLYGYDYLDYYFTEEKRFAYFIKVNKSLAGFAMVNNYPVVPNKPTDFSIAEFFILYNYRKQGIGKVAACKVFDKHLGNWQLKRHPSNLDAVSFWNRVIDEYTNSNYTLINAFPDSEVAYEDGVLADVFFFSNDN